MSHMSTHAFPSTMSSFGSKLIFPVDGQVAETTFGDEFRTDIEETDGSEASNSLWSFSRAVIDISGMKFTEAQRRLLRGFHRIVQGAGETFLFRRSDDPEYEMQDELLGTGNGAQTAFQCRVYDEQQGRSASYIVRWLDHDYPPIGLDVYGNTTRPTSRLDVRVSGVLKTLGAHYTVNRETGIITFLAGNIPQAGQQVRVTGGFYVLVRCEDLLSLTPLGSGWYEAADGTKLIEPKSGI